MVCLDHAHACSKVDSCQTSTVPPSSTSPKLMESTDPSIRIRCALHDKSHGLAIPIVVSGPASLLETLTVADFMLQTQTNHRSQPCTLCPGLLLVKTAWLVHISDPESECLPDTLEHNPGAGITLMQAASLLSAYISMNFPGDKDTIRVLLETTFEGKSL